MLAVNRFRRDDLGQTTHEPATVLNVPQGPVQSRGRNLKYVRVSERVLDVENGAQVPAQLCAIADADALVIRIVAWGLGPRAVHGDSQDPADRFSTQSNVEDLEPVARPYPLSDGPDLIEEIVAFHVSRLCLKVPPQKKSGLTPTLFKEHPST